MRFNYTPSLVVILLFTFSFISAQKVEYKVTKFDNVKKLKTINLSEIEDDYMPLLQNLEAPSVSGKVYKKFLAKRKEEIKEKYPPDYTPLAKKRSFVNPPELLKNFVIFNIQTGRPIDNHLAMNGDEILSCGNSYMSIHNPNGGQIKKNTLVTFGQQVGITDRLFDPRLVYDTNNDRYIFTFLSGDNPGTSTLIVAFSATNDPAGDWHVYTITGNPNNGNQWSDYPMLAITNDKLYYTINLLIAGESWQEGFEETVIWEMDLATAYGGTDLGLSLINGISYEGTNIRNLCPVESATELIYDDMHFLSSRNFAMESDTFFMVKVNPSAAGTDDFLTISLIHSDTPYGAPPNAKQRVGFLQTNDARVLEAFRIENEIQLVGNTRNLDNNLAGVYHGIIEDISNPDIVKLNHIIGSDYELGYPGLIYTGETFSDRDAIIAFNRTSADILPGVSALYSIPGEGYSPIILLGEGNNHVDMGDNTELERWGDYLGTQRDYNNPSEGWVAGFVGIGNAINVPLISRVMRPEVPTSTEEVEIIEKSTQIFPNPIQDRTSVEINVPFGTKSIQVNLVSITGELMDVIYTSKVIKGGKNAFSFDTSTLIPGTYIVKVLLDNKEVKSEKVVKM